MEAILRGGYASLSGDPVSFVVGLLGFVVCLTLGSICTVYPHRVQSFATKSGLGALLNPLSRWGPLRRYMEGSLYTFSVRMTGVIALLMAAAILYGLLRSRSLSL